jgi:hypothetical protein
MCMRVFISLLSYTQMYGTCQDQWRKRSVGKKITIEQLFDIDILKADAELIDVC